MTRRGMALIGVGLGVGVLIVDQLRVEWLNLEARVDGLASDVVATVDEQDVHALRLNDVEGNLVASSEELRASTAQRIGRRVAMRGQPVAGSILGTTGPR